MQGKFIVTKNEMPTYLSCVLSITFLLLPSIREQFVDAGFRWVYVLGVAFLLSYCLTPVAGWIAYKTGILDIPNERKPHLEATPLLGGASVFLAFILGIVLNGIYSPELVAILVSSAILFFTGVADDFFDISASFKLVVQIVCSGGVIASGVVLNVMPENFGILAFIFNAGLTAFWIIGITNAMNFFDGMDGLATGLGAVISFFLGVVAFQTGQAFIGWISVAMTASCLGFMPYNFRKNQSALIFLGDAGSTVIGFILASVAVYGEWSNTSPVVALVSPLLVFWILIFDMIYITIDRILLGKVTNVREWIDYVGRDHLHHRIEQILGRKRQSVIFILCLSMLLGISAIVLRNARIIDAVLLLLQASILVILISILERRGRYINRHKDPKHDRRSENPDDDH